MTANKSALLTVSRKPDTVMVEGSGMRLRDSEGREYLDFIGGWAVNCLGHCPPAISEVLKRQADTLLNASPSFYNEPLLEYAGKLVGNSALDRVFFMSTGAEANESAIKLARKYGLTRKGGATEIITTQNSFHGRTLMTMAATGKDHWETLYGDKMPGFRKAIFNDLESVKALVNDKTCAVMVEPVQGEGGVNVGTPEFIQGLRQLCDEQGILLIFDEVQTGMGRTGKLFAYEHYGIEPDIMTLGKGIGGGYPLSAMLCREALNIFEPGDQGGTYTGQPLAMAVGLAVLNELLKPGFMEHVDAMSNYVKERLVALSTDFEISNIRGPGLLLAFDLEQSKGADIVTQCLAEGLILNSPKSASIRLIPPLIVGRDDIDEMFATLVKYLKKRRCV